METREQFAQNVAEALFETTQLLQEEIEGDLRNALLELSKGLKSLEEKIKSIEVSKIPGSVL